MYHNDPNSDISPKGSGIQSSANDGFIDFAKAKRLKTGGMTCDAYVTRYLQRNVFVKKIKDEKRNDLIIRAAFAKEAELGFNLEHKALPKYRFFGGDYIVMDFVNGQTLSSMIAESDPWLDNPENIRRMLTVLVDVIDYLHQNNVIHCDVKCDNVMVTRDTHNVMLIDLGEAYTFALDNTSGNPEVYGLDKDSDLGNPDLDFRGLGKIIDRLQSAGYPLEMFRRFREMCDKPDVTPAELLDAIRVRNNKKWIWVAVAGLILLTVIVVLVLTNRTETAIETSRPTEPAAQRDTVVVVQPPTDAPPSNPTKEVDTPAPIKSDYKSVINRESAQYFRKQHEIIDSGEALLASGKATDDELNNLSLSLSNAWSECYGTACRVFKMRFPDVAPVDIELAVASSPGYTNANNRMSALIKKQMQEKIRRDPELLEYLPQYYRDEWLGPDSAQFKTNETETRNP